MKKVFLAAFLLAASLPTWAKSPCDAIVPYGTPQVTYQAQYLCRSSYLQLHNNETKTGGLAIELLTPTTIGTGNEPRTNNFRADIEVPRESRSSPKDYAASGFDKGHLAPAGDMKEDGQSMSQSFFMSNMAPQYPMHNEVIWRELELKVHTWSLKDGRNLYVMTGTIFAKKPVDTIGNGVAVPTAFFKAVIDKDRKDAIAYVIPNQKCCFKTIAEYQTTLGDLQKLVGYNFLPEADAATRQTLLSANGASFALLTFKAKKKR